MKTYPLELTAMELGMLTAMRDIARDAIERGTPEDELPAHMDRLQPLFRKISEASARAYLDEHGTASRQG